MDWARDPVGFARTGGSAITIRQELRAGQSPLVESQELRFIPAPITNILECAREERVEPREYQLTTRSTLRTKEGLLAFERVFKLGLGHL